ncbi:MAG: SGNH/GDSL hydrolase family protein, partial [Gemmataceae bacterium]|nr:SGNH/GDSL hydrolase family protein [Gemmataceae bacterium]
MFTLYTFGDSILDSGRYNPLRLTAGQLLVRNDDARFPEFAGCDLASRGPAELIHRAVDGATVRSLRLQTQDLPVRAPAAALLTMGGNDLLSGLIAGTGAGIDAFGRELEAFLLHLPIRPVLIGNVYDPTFGDDAKNFL